MSSAGAAAPWGLVAAGSWAQTPSHRLGLQLAFPLNTEVTRGSFCVAKEKDGQGRVQVSHHTIHVTIP